LIEPFTTLAFCSVILAAVIISLITKSAPHLIQSLQQTHAAAKIDFECFNVAGGARNASKSKLCKKSPFTDG